MKSIKKGEYIYNKNKILGSGSFGKVYLCKCIKTNKIYALKIISSEKLVNLGDYGQKLLTRELKNHKEASKSGIPFFVKLIDSFLRNDNLFLILEYCDSDLLNYLELNIPEEIILRLIMQIGIGLLYLHSVGIIHRDIKLSNIFLKEGNVKIGDFGFATKDISPHTELGTLPYKAPEIFQKDSYDTKIDVWALNTVFYKFLTKKFFFSTENSSVYLNEIRNKKYFMDKKYCVSSSICDLLRKGYIKNRFDRPNILEYLNHTAFDKVRKDYKIFFSKLPKMIKTDKCNLDKIIKEMTNYINNILKYAELARKLKTKKNNNIISFFLIKKGLQKLSTILMCWKNRICPSFIRISKTEWRNLKKNKKFNQLLMKCIRNIKIMKLEFLRFLNDFKNAYKGNRNIIFENNLNNMKDLNLEIDNTCFNFYFKKTYKHEKKSNLNSELLIDFEDVFKYEKNTPKIY